MDRLDENYTVSTRHVGLRTLAFVLVVVLAIGAFGYGVSRMAYKEEGYYEIETAQAEEAPNYAGGFHLIYYFEGSSDEIRLSLNALKELYNGALLRSFQLLDTEKEYQGLVNLATLNAAPGIAHEVSDELLWVLKDGVEKTREHRGFHLFAGALYREWNSILSLDDISEFDPAVNSDTAERIRLLAEKTSDPDSFEMQFSGNTVTWRCSEDYERFLEEGEYEGGILDTNLLKDAYRLAMVRDVLVSNGYCNGYLLADSGLILYLPEHRGGKFVMYTCQEGKNTTAAMIEAEPNSAYSFLHSYPIVEGEVLYHVTERGYYHPCFAVETGDFPSAIAAEFTLRQDGGVVAAAYQNMVGFGMETPEALLSDSGGAVYGYTLWDDPAVIHTNDPNMLTPESGCTIAG